MSDKYIREPAVAGLFYNKLPKKLKSEIAELIDGQAAHIQPNAHTRALIVPHAGYIYSGKVAAAAYKTLPKNKKWQRIVIIGTSHKAHFEGAAIFTGAGFNTPLGIVEVDTEFANKLIGRHHLLSANNNVHASEHTIEVQLPMLQVHLKHPFKIVPILIGSQNPDDCQSIATALIPFFTPDTLFIISSDFSHYPGYIDALTADADTADAIASNNPDTLLSQLEINKNTQYPNLQTSLCGWSAVLTLMYLTQPNTVQYKKIRYENSGDAAIGDKSHVVGYWAISVSTIEQNSINFTASQKKEMLQWARTCLNHHLTHSPLSTTAQQASNNPMHQKLGVFVSLYNKQQLRGCIGRFEANKPLWQLIQEMTYAAAFNDHRFDTVKAHEIEDIRIELSILTPMQRIFDYRFIEPGKHGVYLKFGNRSGTFLPQVAIKTGWTTEELLGHLSHDKAGLGWETWREAELFIYEAIVIQE
jgi:MEMO1 family protein